MHRSITEWESVLKSMTDTKSTSIYATMSKTAYVLLLQQAIEDMKESTGAAPRQREPFPSIDAGRNADPAPDPIREVIDRLNEQITQQHADADSYRAFAVEAENKAETIIKQRDAIINMAVSCGETRAALLKAVTDYGQPGGPWNVPDEPGTWINMAKAALKGGV